MHTSAIAHLWLTTGASVVDATEEAPCQSTRCNVFSTRLNKLLSLHTHTHTHTHTAVLIRR
jgi:hypothetical protein